METHNHVACTIQDFESKAQDLIHVMLAICEGRMLTEEKLNSSVGAALAEAALTVKASLRTFVFIERLPGA